MTGFLLKTPFPAAPEHLSSCSRKAKFFHVFLPQIQIRCGQWGWCIFWHSFVKHLSKKTEWSRILTAKRQWVAHWWPNPARREKKKTEGKNTLCGFAVQIQQEETVSQMQSNTTIRPNPWLDPLNIATHYIVFFLFSIFLILQSSKPQFPNMKKKKNRLSHMVSFPVTVRTVYHYRQHIKTQQRK